MNVSWPMSKTEQKQRHPPTPPARRYAAFACPTWAGLGWKTIPRARPFPRFRDLCRASIEPSVMALERRSCRSGRRCRKRAAWSSGGLRRSIEACRTRRRSRCVCPRGCGSRGDAAGFEIDDSGEGESRREPMDARGSCGLWATSSTLPLSVPQRRSETETLL